MDTLKRRDFKKMYYEDDDKWYYVRTKLQATKNHQKGSQDLRKGGVIPFEENEMGVDSGLYLELYMKLLNPGNECMFQQPRYGKKFKKTIHKKQAQPNYFYAKKIGHMLVAEMMPKVNLRPLN
jgi:hypothetical protein